MRIAELLDRLAQVAPRDKAADWDPVGLQLGDPAAEAAEVAVCHEVNAEVAGVLKENPPDLVVTYHPLLFRPGTRIVAGPGPTGRAFELLRAGVAVAVVHTSFDAAAGGTADALAETLGLEQVQPMASSAAAPAVKIVAFVPDDHLIAVREAMAQAGGGVIGNYTQCSFRVAGVGSFLAGAGTSPFLGQAGELNEETESRLEMVAPSARADAVVTALASAHPYDEPAFDVYDIRATSFFGRIGRLPEPGVLAELADEVGRRLDVSPVRYTGPDQSAIHDVAVVPGSGADFIQAALSSRADVLITGDVSHHRAVSAVDRGLAVIDPGHTAGERPGVVRLLEAVREIIPGAADLTGVAAGPWNWTI